MARFAAVYQDENDSAKLFFIGSASSDHRLTAEDIIEKNNVDMNEFALLTGIEEINPEMLLAIDASDDDEILDNAEIGDELPTLYANFETPNGMRSLEIPAIGEWYNAVRIVDPEVADAHCDLIDITKTAEYPLYSKEDLDVAHWVVLTGPEYEECVIRECRDREEAIHEADLYWNHLTATEKKKNNVIAAYETYRVSGCWSDLEEIVWKNGEVQE